MDVQQFKRSHRRSERGGALASMSLLFAGVLLGLGLAAIIYRAGQGQSGAYFSPGRPFLEAKPVLNRLRGQNNPVSSGSGSPPTPGRVDLGTQDAIVSAVEKVGPAVVNIDVRMTGRDRDLPPFLREFMPRGSDPPPEREGEGSGVIINGREGYVLTNNHVVREANRILVKLKDGRRFVGKVIGVDNFSDVALVKIPGGNLPTATLGSSKDLPVGSWAIAIGNPLGFQHTVTVGVISASGRDLFPLENLIQTDAAINPGNSGGALCDIYGNVIGINTAIIPTAQGLGFAVNIETVKYVVEELLRNGKVNRAWMGVSFETLDEELARRKSIKQIPGVYIASVQPNQPAAKAGLRRGDVITAVNNRPVQEDNMLRDFVRRRKPGEKLTFLVARGGKAMVFTVTLGVMPDLEKLMREP